MRRSQFFMPILKETPVEATIASHQLMLRAGMIRQTSSGIYAWLPLGKKILQKIEQIVREEQDATGAQEMLMPTIQPAELWEKSGRYDAYGKEMLKITDRHDRGMLYGPTNEEMITDIFGAYVRSYKDLPKNLYHIQWKFRDEIRPRFGIMRGREFLMKDNYSFDMNYEGALRSYQKMFLAYMRTFARMGIKAIPMKADTGPIGGDLSHEFIVLADTGESEVFVDKQWEALDILSDDVDYDGDLNALYERYSSIYAATDEKHEEDNCPVAKADLLNRRGIEVGHIFYFGDKYTKALDCKVMGPDGKEFYPEMGSYGVGVSRLMGALIEANHDENGIIWPESVAPFKVGLINLKVGDEACDAAAEDLYNSFKDAGVDTLYDDSDERAGGKFATMDLIGLPWQIVVGPRGVKEGMVELKNRATGEKMDLSFADVKNKMIAKK